MKLLMALDAFIWGFERAGFYRSLANAFNQKVGLRAFLMTASDNAVTLGNARAKRIIKRIYARLGEGQGKNLAELLFGIMPRSDAMLLVSVDEAKAEDQAQALLAVARSVDFKQAALWSACKAAIMPVVVVPFVGFLSFITAKSIEGLAQSNSNPAIWAGFNGFVRSLAFFVLHNWLMMVIALVATIALALWYFPRVTGRLRLKVDRLPVLGIYRDFQGAIAINALGLMLANGKSFVAAVDRLRHRANPWTRWQLARITNALKDNPKAYVAAMNRGLFSPRLTVQLAEHMQSKSMDEALIEMAKSETDVIRRQLDLSMTAVGESVTYALALVAVVLGLGIMTIGTSLSEQASKPQHLQSPAQ